MIGAVARGLAGLGRLLFRTVRCEIVESAPRISPYAPTGNDRYLYCIWHDGILGVLFSGRCLNVAGLASRHADGSYVADAMASLGITPIRGSSRHGGAAAVRQMMDAAENQHIAIATDGPRGPRRVVKPGIIFLAMHSGRLIIPVAYAARGGWRPRGKWTDMVIPRPFGRSVLMGGPPLQVPANLDRDGQEHYRLLLQQQMDALNVRAEQLAQGRDDISPVEPAENTFRGASAGRRAA